MAGDDVVQRWQRALVRHMSHLDAGHAGEQLGVEVVRRTRPAGAVGQLAWIGLGVLDQLLDRFYRQIVVDDENERRSCNHHQRHKIGRGIIRQLLVQRSIDRHWRRRRHQERIAIGLGMSHQARADHGAGAGFVLDDNWLADAFLELLPDQTRQDLGRTTGRVRNDDGDRLGRIVVCAHGLRAASYDGEQCCEVSCSPQPVE